MNGRTRGIVIALASGAAGGVLPAAISAHMLDAHAMAAGLGVVALMNAAIAMVHIAVPVGPDRARNDDRKTEATANRVAVTLGHVELKAADGGGDAPPAEPKPPKEPLRFPVFGWYGPNPVGAEHLLDLLPPDVVAKKSAKTRA